MLCAPGSPSHRRWAPRSGGGKRRSPCPGMVQRLVQPLHDALICGPSRSWRTLFRLTHARRSEEIRILGPSLHSPSQPLSLRGGAKSRLWGSQTHRPASHRANRPATCWCLGKAARATTSGVGGLCCHFRCVGHLHSTSCSPAGSPSSADWRRRLR